MEKKKKEINEKGIVQITMDKEFSKFKDEEKKKFEDDLSKITEEEKIKKKKYRRGCVCFEGEINQNGIDKIQFSFDNRNTKDNSIIINNIDSFIRKYSVKRIFQIEKMSVNIFIKKNKPTNIKNYICKTMKSKTFQNNQKSLNFIIQLIMFKKFPYIFREDREQIL